MDIKKLTKKACSKAVGYTLIAGENDPEQREIYGLIKPQDPSAPVGTYTRCHCIIIYNDILFEELPNDAMQEEKIYIDSFNIKADPKTLDVIDKYFERPPFKLRRFFDIKSAASHIDELIKANNERIKREEYIAAEKEELKNILDPLKYIVDYIPEMRSDLDLLMLNTKEGKKLKRDAEEMLHELVHVANEFNFY